MHELIAAFSYICSQEKSKKNNKLWKKNRKFEEIYLFNRTENKCGCSPVVGKLIPHVHKCSLTETCSVRTRAQVD